MRYLRNARGITLIEMVVVGVIIGVLSAMAIPKWLEIMPKMRTKAEIRDIVSTLREARSLSISTNTAYGVYFDQVANQYTLFIDRETPELQTFTAGDSTLVTNQVENGVDICYGTFSNSTVIFSPDGSASTSGALCLSSEDLQHYYNVDILQSTGRIKTQEGYPLTTITVP